MRHAFQTKAGPTEGVAVTHMPALSVSRGNVDQDDPRLACSPSWAACSASCCLSWPAPSRRSQALSSSKSRWALRA